MSYWSRRDAVQSYLAERGWHGWLLMDFRGSNPLLWQVLGRQPQGGHLTRRTFCWIASSSRGAEPEREVVVLAHAIEAQALADPRWELRTYHDRHSLHDALRALVPAGATIAMEYSPMAELPYVSRVDGGTLDLVRSLGAAIVSSADLLQLAIAQWDERQIEQHQRAAALVDLVREEAFELVALALQRGRPIDEYTISHYIEQRFETIDLLTVYHPTVAVGPHTANPHYEPSPAGSHLIGRDDWLLIDLWARVNEPGSPFADVTWVAWTGPSPVPAEIEQVFETVRAARDLALARLEAAAASGRALEGWEIDRAVRDFIAAQGYGPYFTHRTGHNLGPEEVHGSAGACLDDFETHDTRLLLPGIAFSIEPGIYLPGRFGVRLELNAVMTPAGPRVYTPVQHEVIVLTGAFRGNGKAADEASAS